jgi:hypothetical protein
MPALHVVTDDCCAPGSPCASCQPAPQVRDARWHGAARAARWLSWASLAWMCTEGAVGLWQGLAAGSIALTGWALGSAVEGLASVIVIWRFTGARTLSETAEQRAQRAVAASFWLLVPYIASESAWDLATGHHAEPTATGIALTAVALAVMPGRRRPPRPGRHRRLARRLVGRPRHRPGHRRRSSLGRNPVLARRRLLLTGRRPVPSRHPASAHRTAGPAGRAGQSAAFDQLATDTAPHPDRTALLPSECLAGPSRSFR